MLLTTIRFSSGGECSLRFDKTNRWLYAQWSGLIHEPEYVTASPICWQAASELPCTHLLSDARALHGPLFDPLEWLQQTWLEQVGQRGLRWLAHVAAPTNQLSPSVPAGLLTSIELQVFDDLADAQEWLRTRQLTSCCDSARPTESTQASPARSQ